MKQYLVLPMFLALLLPTFFQAYLSAQTEEKTTEQLLEEQRVLSEQYKSLEEKLFTLHEYESGNNPVRSKLLEKAFLHSQETNTVEQLKEIVALLDSEKLRDAESSQKEVLGNLKSLLVLLESEDRNNRVRDDIERYQDILKEVNRIQRMQSGVRGQAEGGVDSERLKNSQERIANRTGKLGEDLDEFDKSDGELSEGESDPSDEDPEEKDAEGAEGSEGGTEGKGSESEGAKGSEGEGSEGSEGEGSEGAQGEEKDPDKDPDENSKDPSDKNPDDKDPSGKETDDKDPSEKDSEGKPSESSPSDSEGTPPDSEGTPSDSESEPSESSTPPSEGEPSESSGGSGSPGEPGEEPEEPQDPIREKIKAAEESMRNAQEKLEEARRSESIEEMKEAEKQLAEAKEALEEILRQLREEEVERVLAMLEGRFRQMLERQIKIYENTRKLDRTSSDNRLTDFEIKTGKLSIEEKAVAIEAARALNLLREDGSSVAFTETVEQMHGDMDQVASRLASAKVGAITQEIQEDIIETLDYMIEALVQAQEDMQEQEQSPPPPGESQGGGPPGDEPLVDQIAELKMVRGLQERILRRHKRYSRLLENPDDLIGRTEDPELRRALDRLRARQEKLTEITRDIATGKNQ